MSIESHGSIITRSTVQPHPDDRRGWWARKRFIQAVRDDVRDSVQRVLQQHRHYLSTPNPFIRIPELDDLLDFLAVPHKRRQVNRRSLLRFLLSILGWIGLSALVSVIVILSGLAVA